MGNLFSFKGRVGRQAYWLVTLAGIALYAMFVALQATLDPWTRPQVYTTYSGGTQVYWGTSGTLFIYGLFMVAWLILAIVGLSVGVRRWHDLGKSGWWVFIGFVPIVGGLYAFIMQGFMPGEPGPNAYDTGSSIGVTRQQSALQRDALHALPVAAILSFAGSVIMIVAALGAIDDSSWRGSYYGSTFATYGYLMLAGVTAVLAWLVGSYYGSDLVDRMGFRPVSIVADAISGVVVFLVAFWFPPYLLLLILVFFAVALRIAAYTAYRSMMPEITARIRLPSVRVNALFDSFPYFAFFIVPLLAFAVQRASSGLFRGASLIEWLYVIFFTFSALFVAIALPSLNTAGSSPGVPEPVERSRMDAGMTLVEDAADWS